MDWRSTAKIFAFVGPFIGAILTAVTVTIMVAVSNAPEDMGLVHFAGIAAAGLVAIFVGLLLAVPIGIVPAGLTALAALGLRRLGVARWLYWIGCGLSGGVASEGFARLLQPTSQIGLFFFIGAATALICALITWRPTHKAVVS